MTAGVRLSTAFFVLAALGLGAPLLAQGTAQQNGAQQAPASPPPREQVIGPPQIQDFSLNGSVTRRAEEPAESSQPARPSTTQTPARSAGTAQPQTQPVRPEQTASGTSGAAARRPNDSETQTRTAQSDSGVAPASSPSFPISTAPPAASFDLSGEDSPEFDSAEDFAPAASDEGGSSILPWLLALAVALGGGAFLYFRQRPGLAFAGGVPEPVPDSSPQPRARPIPAPPVKPVSAGIVASNIRAWLEPRFVPVRCSLTEQGVTIDFELTLINSGPAPARDVLVEAAVLNAGPAQAKEIEEIFAFPAGKGARSLSVEPMKRISVTSSVTMPIGKMRLFQVEGRSLFVPLVALNILYRTGGKDAQSSAVWLIGRDNKGAKLAPFRADLGARLFRTLGARELEQKVRR